MRYIMSEKSDIFYEINKREQIFPSGIYWRMDAFLGPMPTLRRCNRISLKMDRRRIQLIFRMFNRRYPNCLSFLRNIAEAAGYRPERDRR